jgi:sec-independent protein translocase protein TatB
VPGSQELLVIALVALFVLGPERLPALARSAARGLARLRNYGVAASKELRGVADLGEIEREVNDLRVELARTRADLRRAMRETIASSSSHTSVARPGSQPGELPGRPPSADAIDAVDALGVGGSQHDDEVPDGSDPDSGASSAHGA